MTANETEIAEIDIDEFRPDTMPAGPRRLLLSVPVGRAEPARLPVIAVRGRRPGPTAVLVAGVHGDEFEGMAALPELAASLDPEALRGMTLALPVCNPFARDAQDRCSPDDVDGANLARVFPGDPDGSPTRRLAAALLRLTTRVLDPDGLFVDLHSAGTKYRYLTLAGFRDIAGPARGPSEEAARHFGPGLLWRIWDQRGMFNAEVARAGVPTVATEAPGQGECRDGDVAAYVAALRNLLTWRGMLDGPRPPRSKAQARCPTELTAPASGVLRTGRSVGDQVAGGDPLGRIADAFGQTRAVLRAPHPGQLWALRTFGAVAEGDLIAWVTPP
jgi:N2-acetyl-L-2,4-diaminobutanoate deacetylase